MPVLWLCFLTEFDAYTEEVPQELPDSPEISKAIRLVEESAYTREHLLGYELFWRTEVGAAFRSFAIKVKSANLFPQSPRNSNGVPPNGEAA